MKLDIDKEILCKADKCQKEFSCLLDQKGLCKVIGDIDKNVIFIDKKTMKGSLFCKFAIAFGVSTICACPVRKEIYKKYGV